MLLGVTQCVWRYRFSMPERVLNQLSTANHQIELLESHGIKKVDFWTQGSHLRHLNLHLQRKAPGFRNSKCNLLGAFLFCCAV